MAYHEHDGRLHEGAPALSTNDPASVPGVQRIETDSAALDSLLNHQLTTLFHTLLAYERKKTEVQRVDGLIIGTGEADFTKGNTLYPLTYKGKRFQLIDMPGIEGNESKYEHMVREAVAKAHLIFYVNGTNKKPERATAEKIRTYLRLGTQVCPLINIRGNADAYEFEEDRESLTGHNDSTTALELTEEVLSGVLSDKILQTGHCVQGLLAFSALAINEHTGRTTIHPSRDRDLVIQQRNYLKHFTSHESMYEFSQIDSVAKVLSDKLLTFREDMVESNKVKVQELLGENAAALEELYAAHEEFVDETQTEFKKCHEAIQQAWTRFERSVVNGQKNLVDKLFNSLGAAANQAIEDHFGDSDAISEQVNQTFRDKQKALEKELIELLASALDDLRHDLQQATQRLYEDLARVEFEQLLTNTNILDIDYKTPKLGLGLEFGDYGLMALSFGSYTIAGLGIGSLIPVVGNIVGAVAGAVAGIFFSVVNLLSSKERRIRKAQQQMQKKINTTRNEAKKALKEDHELLLTKVRKQIDEVSTRVQQIDKSLKRPLKIIEQQMTIMKQIKAKLEEMPYGAIQAI